MVLQLRRFQTLGLLLLLTAASTLLRGASAFTPRASSGRAFGGVADAAPSRVRRLLQQNAGTVPQRPRHAEARRDGQLWATTGSDSDGLASSDSSGEGDNTASSTPTGVEQRQRRSDEEATTKKKPAAKAGASVVVCPDCDLCDGSGRIAGGLGAVLPWLPVKAYRPCPNFVDRGGIYQRSGQGLDEIAFGRDSTYNGGPN